MENVIVVPVKYFKKMRKKLNYLHKGCHEYGVFHLLHCFIFCSSRFYNVSWIIVVVCSSYFTFLQLQRTQRQKVDLYVQVLHNLCLNHGSVRIWTRNKWSFWRFLNIRMSNSLSTVQIFLIFKSTKFLEQKILLILGILNHFLNGQVMLKWSLEKCINV